MISPVIKSKITNSSFMHLALNPKLWFSAEWCIKNSLINQKVKHLDLDFELEQKVEELSLYSTGAIQGLKYEERLDSLESEMNRLAVVSGDLVTSDETKRILKTFIER